MDEQISKLVDSGVIWPEGGQARSQGEAFSSDIQPGLSDEEKSIILIQAQLFLK